MFRKESLQIFCSKGKFFCHFASQKSTSKASRRRRNFNWNQRENFWPRKRTDLSYIVWHNSNGTHSGASFPARIHCYRFKSNRSISLMLYQLGTTKQTNFEPFKEPSSSTLGKIQPVNFTTQTSESERRSELGIAHLTPWPLVSSTSNTPCSLAPEN